MRTIKIKNQNVLFLSDTHGKHRLINIPKNIQIIIHCGDICNGGNMSEIIDFFNWYEKLNISHKVFVHGNHDLPFELEPAWSKKLIPDNIYWLNDDSITINKINIMGISYFPFFQHLEQKKEIDIMISHYPPFGILDGGFGSQEINDFINQYQPKYHVFGHNHLNNGKIKHKKTQYINTSIYHKLF
jgi:Icc-related predicted phosphoesterase